MPEAETQAAPVSSPTDVSTTFTYNNAMYGVTRDGRITKLDRNRITWIDTGLQLP